MIGPILKGLGHDVAYLAAFGHHGSMTEHKGIPVYPGGLDGFGNDVIGNAARDFRADIVLTLKDLWVYRPHEWGQGIRWVPLVPVDHDPIPEGIVHLIRQHCYHPIAYSKFGEAQLYNVGFAPSYAPHTFDPAVMFPMDKAEARKTFGLPDDIFAVGMVAVNRGGVPSRKAWPQNLDGFARFAQRHPKAHLFLHTHTGETGREGAVNLKNKAARLGIMHRISFVDQSAYDRGLPVEYMRMFYNAMNIVNTVSVGEGFGIPTLEAQACGTPVLVGDWTASAELLFAGAAISRQHAFEFDDAQESYIFLPEPDAIAIALSNMAERLSNPIEAERLRERAIAGAAPYATGAVQVAHWTKVLERIEHLIVTEPARGVLRIVRPESVLVAQEAVR